MIVPPLSFITSLVLVASSHQRNVDPSAGSVIDNEPLVLAVASALLVKSSFGVVVPASYPCIVPPERGLPEESKSWESG